MRPNAGTIRLGDRDITHLDAAERVALGLGRTFQITSLLDDGGAAEPRAGDSGAQGGNLRIFDRLGARADIWAEVDAMLAGTPLETARISASRIWPTAKRSSWSC